jgi:hypothetical protein
MLFRTKESKEVNPHSNEVQNGTSQSDNGLNHQINQAISANILQEIKEILNRLQNKNQ